MTYKNIAKLIPTIQAVNLAQDNLEFSKKKKKKTKDYTKQSMRNIVGVSLIGATASIVDDL